MQEIAHVRRDVGGDQRGGGYDEPVEHDRQARFGRRQYDPGQAEDFEAAHFARDLVPTEFRAARQRGIDRGDFPRQPRIVDAGSATGDRMG